MQVVSGSLLNHSSENPTSIVSYILIHFDTYAPNTYTFCVEHRANGHQPGRAHFEQT